jgi:hypothetical protein
VPLNEYEFPTSKLSNVQSQLEKLVEKNYYLHQSAKEAFRCVSGTRSGCRRASEQRGCHSRGIELGKMPAPKASMGWAFC